MSQCTREVPCNPCPKYCRRPAPPRFGWFGALGYIVEAITIVWVGFMLIGVASRDYRVVLGLLLGTIILDFIFWGINLFTAAPCYSIQLIPTACDPCGCEIILRDEPCDFYARSVAYIHHNNDQWHLSTSIMGGLYVLFFFGWFVGSHGGQTFNALNTTFYNGNAVMAFVVSQSLLLATIGAFSFGFKLFLETHTDLTLRLSTAIFEPVQIKRDDVFVPRKVGTVVGNRKDPLGAFSS